MRRRFPFVQLDVFTGQPLHGNQLAVFTDARGLSDAEMQALAKETNLSETTFVFPRDEATERAHGVKVRIFTVNEELPFAGHPTLGTAAIVRGGKPKVELDLIAGKIPVTFDDGGFGEMRQRDPEFGAIHSVEAVARAIGFSPDDIRADVPIQTVSTGMAFTIVPIRSLRAIQNVVFEWPRAAAYLGKTGGKFFHMVTTETMDPAARLHARMIFYNGEDPATGSASGCAAAWMVKYGIAASGERALIEQGIEINRPSRIFVSAEKSGDQINNVRVGGHCVEVARGEYHLP